MTGTIPFRRVVSEVDSRAADLAESLELLSVSQQLGVIPRSTITDKEPRAEDLTNYKRCWPGDLVLNRMSAYQGALGLARQDGIVSPDYAVLRSGAALEPRFLAYIMKSQWFVGEMTARLRGIGSPGTGSVRTPRVNVEDLGTIELPLPPVEEQRRIADFLDDQVARVDAVLADCRELDAQNEQAFQSAVIERTTYAATGGAIAATGLPWKPLAESSWNIRPLRSFLRYAKAPVGERWTDFCLLSLTKQGVIPRDVESNFGKFPESFDTYQAVEPGDLVMCLFDVDETPRTVGLAHERGMVTGAYTRFVWTDPEMSGRFVEYALIGIDDQKAFRPLYTGMRKGIQTGRFLSARLPIPPNATQLAVVEELDARRHSLGLFRTENAQRSGLLEERKRSLITAAVTGELDVTTAKPIGMGKWVPNVGAGVERPAAAQASGIGGIG